MSGQSSSLSHLLFCLRAQQIVLPFGFSWHLYFRDLGNLIAARYVPTVLRF